jgi:hypothetical protein
MMYFVDSSSITTDNLILIVVGSVGALAVVIAISVCVAYAYSVKRYFCVYAKHTTLKRKNKDLVSSESGYCVRMGRNVYLKSVVSVR